MAEYTDIFSTSGTTDYYQHSARAGISFCCRILIYILSSISSESALRNSSVAVKLSGASEFSGNVETGLLDLDISGASTVAIEGSATKLVMNLSDASEVSKKVSGNRYALACDECDVTMSGASDAYIHCNGKINILFLSGASDLHYTGNALITLTGNSVSGGSDIVQDTL